MPTNDTERAATGKPFFKHEQPSRVDERLERDAAEAKCWRDVCAVVDTRDHKQCRACGKRSDPERTGLLARGHRHHIVYRSAGGPDAAWNLLLLCASCHNDEHKDRLRFTAEGGPYLIDAGLPMEFWRKDAEGGWYLSRREIAVGRAEKD